jgi:hypothetical protein
VRVGEVGARWGGRDGGGKGRRRKIKVDFEELMCYII